MTFLGTAPVPRQPANIVGPDDRFHITEIFEKLGLANYEMLQIRQSTGVIYCPGTVHDNPILASAAIVHRDNVLVTNAHTFVDENGNRREPLSACFFQTQGVMPERVGLDFSPGKFEISENWAAHRSVNDYAVLRTSQALRYARAFPLAPAADLAADQSFILISARSKRAANRFNVKEPIAQSCKVRQNFAPTENHGSVFYGDCDISLGASGSVGLMRINGRLHAFSVASGGGFDISDGRPYGVEAGSYSYHTYFNDRLLAAVLRVAK